MATTDADAHNRCYIMFSAICLFVHRPQATGRPNKEALRRAVDVCDNNERTATLDRPCCLVALFESAKGNSGT